MEKKLTISDSAASSNTFVFETINKPVRSPKSGANAVWNTL